MCRMPMSNVQCMWRARLLCCCPTCSRLMNNNTNACICCIPRAYFDNCIAHASAISNIEYQAKLNNDTLVWHSVCFVRLRLFRKQNSYNKYYLFWYFVSLHRHTKQCMLRTIRAFYMNAICPGKIPMLFRTMHLHTISNGPNAILN